MVVTTPGGSSTVTAADQYSYVVPAPAVTAVSPNSGLIAGGTSVTITGTELYGECKAFFGLELASG